MADSTADQLEEYRDCFGAEGAWLTGLVIGFVIKTPECGSARIEAKTRIRSQACNSLPITP